MSSEGSRARAREPRKQNEERPRIIESWFYTPFFRNSGKPKILRIVPGTGDQKIIDGFRAEGIPAHSLQRETDTFIEVLDSSGKCIGTLDKIQGGVFPPPLPRVAAHHPGLGAFEDSRSGGYWTWDQEDFKPNPSMDPFYLSRQPDGLSDAERFAQWEESVRRKQSATDRARGIYPWLSPAEQERRRKAPRPIPLAPKPSGMKTVCLLCKKHLKGHPYAPVVPHGYCNECQGKMRSNPDEYLRGLQRKAELGDEIASARLRLETSRRRVCLFCAQPAERFDSVRNDFLCSSCFWSKGGHKDVKGRLHFQPEGFAPENLLRGDTIVVGKEHYPALRVIRVEQVPSMGFTFGYAIDSSAHVWKFTRNVHSQTVTGLMRIKRRPSRSERAVIPGLLAEQAAWRNSPPFERTLSHRHNPPIVPRFDYSDQYDYIVEGSVVTIALHDGSRTTGRAIRNSAPNRVPGIEWLLYPWGYDVTRQNVISVSPPVRRNPSFGGDAWTFTPAEKLVAELILQGFSNKEIAARRRSSAHTIHTQVSKIFRKAGVTDRAQFINKFMARGGSVSVLPSLSEAGLTPSEIRVALLMLQSKSVKEIAHSLRKTTHTVKTQMEAIHRKTGARTYAEFLSLFVEPRRPNATQSMDDLARIIAQVSKSKLPREEYLNVARGLRSLAMNRKLAPVDADALWKVKLPQSAEDYPGWDSTDFETVANYLDDLRSHSKVSSAGWDRRTVNLIEAEGGTFPIEALVRGPWAVHVHLDGFAVTNLWSGLRVKVFSLESDAVKFVNRIDALGFDYSGDPLLWSNDAFNALTTLIYGAPSTRDKMAKVRKVNPGQKFVIQDRFGHYLCTKGPTVWSPDISKATRFSEQEVRKMRTQWPTQSSTWTAVPVQSNPGRGKWVPLEQALRIAEQRGDRPKLERQIQAFAKRHRKLPSSVMVK